MVRSFVTRSVFAAWAFVARLLGAVGLALVRFSRSSPYTSLSESGWSYGWRFLTRPAASFEVDPYLSERRELFTEMLWFFSEPHPDHAGCIPVDQWELLEVVIANRWSGGPERTGQMLAFVRHLATEQDIVIV